MNDEQKQKEIETQNGYDHAFAVSESSDFFTVEKSGQYGVYSYSARKLVVPIEFDFIYKSYPEGMFRVDKNKKQGVYSAKEQKLIVPLEFEMIQELISTEYAKEKNPWMDGKYRVKKDGRTGIFFPVSQTIKWEVAPFQLSDEDYAELNKTSN